MLPYSESLKNIDYKNILDKIHRAIPPGIRRQLSIAVTLKYPMNIGFAFANNTFGKMTLVEKQDEE